MNVQFKKGILELCILSSIAKKEQYGQYGYDLIKEMRHYFPEVEDSAFYVILRRLKNNGDLEQYTGTESGGPARKYYRITEEGRKQLDRLLRDWDKLVGIVEEIV